MQTSWGMTELSPLGTIAPARDSKSAVASGRPPMGLDLKLTDADGATLPQQRNVTGHLKVKGASVVERYFKAETDALDSEGYFDTGDLASIDDEGNLTVRLQAADTALGGGVTEAMRSLVFAWTYNTGASAGHFEVDFKIKALAA